MNFAPNGYGWGYTTARGQVSKASSILNIFTNIFWWSWWVKKIFLCETEFQTYIPYTIFVIVLTLRITSKSISPNGCQILIMVFSLSIICVDPFPSNFFSNFEDAAH